MIKKLYILIDVFEENILGFFTDIEKCKSIKQKEINKKELKFSKIMRNNIKRNSRENIDDNYKIKEIKLDEFYENGVFE